MTREIRDHGERIGFRLVDISTEEGRTLASVKGIVGPKIGKYRIDLNSLATLAVKAIERARENCDIIVVDEVGPMELLSPEFRRAVHHSILESTKPAICVIHLRYSDPLLAELRSSEEAEEIELNYENRDTVPLDLGKNVIQFLSRKR